MRTSTLVEAVAIALYLAAIVLANLVVTHGGQRALVFTGFFLIPLDLVTRDILHERWHGRALWPRMFVLIASGSVLAYVVNADALRIGIASLVAFAASGLVNAIVYARLWHRSRMVRMNGSNAFAAVVDSVVFPVIAFDVVSVGLCIAQAVLKTAGGFYWSSVYVFLRRRLAHVDHR